MARDLSCTSLPESGQYVDIKFLGRFCLFDMQQTKFLVGKLTLLHKFYYQIYYDQKILMKIFLKSEIFTHFSQQETAVVHQAQRRSAPLIAKSTPLSVAQRQVRAAQRRSSPSPRRSAPLSAKSAPLSVAHHRHCQNSPCFSTRS